ncbi:hypothetical protein KKC16_00765 [Patescibacteria group bacterium]|nr:hypothetical protein [Patescibacteria group bacterium]
MNNNNQILIKSKSGQLKTVGLGVQEKDKVVNKMAPRRSMEPTKRLEPTESIIKSTGMPAFYFHREDEEEAMQYKNGQQAQHYKKEQTILEYVIDAIIKQSNLDISDSATVRLKRVADSRLRDVRDLLETKEVLVRPVELGGVGLSDEQAHKVLKLIEAKRIKMQEGLEKAERELLADETIVEKSILEQVKPISTYIHPSYGEKSNQVPGIKYQEKKKEISGRVIPTSQDVINKMAPRPEFSGEPTRLEPTTKIKDYKLTRDVYQKTQENKRLMGPIEELANISLNDFRKLGASPTEALSKIKNKIGLLADESYEKKAKGIQAWRLSPVYQSYLNLGNASIEQSKSIEEIIKSSNILTQEEFNAISDLSQELNY